VCVCIYAGISGCAGIRVCWCVRECRYVCWRALPKEHRGLFAINGKPAPLSGRGPLKGLKGGCPFVGGFHQKKTDPLVAIVLARQDRSSGSTYTHLYTLYICMCAVGRATTRGHVRSGRHAGPAGTPRPVALSDGKAAQRCPRCRRVPLKGLKGAAPFVGGFRQKKTGPLVAIVLARQDRSRGTTYTHLYTYLYICMCSVGRATPAGMRVASGTLPRPLRYALWPFQTVKQRVAAPPPPDKGAFLYAPFRPCEGLFRAGTLKHTINACVRRYKLAVTPLYSFILGGGGGSRMSLCGPDGTPPHTCMHSCAHKQTPTHIYIYICMHIRTCLRALKALQPPARNWRWPHRARSLRFAPRRPFTGR
jgi:hypothetical protein